MAERERLLRRICQQIQSRAQRGESVQRAFWFFSRRWHGRPYSSDPSKRISLSKGTLTRVYYAFQQIGSQAFRFRYKTPHKLRRALVVEFLKLCGSPGVCSMAAAYDLLTRKWRAGSFIDGFGSWKTWAQTKHLKGLRAAPPFPFHIRCFYRCYTPPELEQIRTLHNARRVANAAERRLQKLITAKLQAAR